MKIVFISRILFLSGVTTHMRDLGAEMVKLGHEVTILTAGNQFPENPASVALEKSLLDVGIRIKIIPYPTDSSNRLRYLTGLMRSFWLTRKELEKGKYDVIHVHTLVLSFIPKLLGYKFVNTTHLAKLQLGPFLCNADEEIAISEEVYDDIIKRGVSDKHIHLVYNGVSIEFAKEINETRISKLKKSLGISDNKILILFVGTLCKRKGLDILCRAFAMMGEKCKNKAELLFLGNCDTAGDRVWLNSVIKETGVEEKTRILGYCPPHDYYQLCDIFVLPSRREGFGLVCIEAMMGNCCIIRSDTEGYEAQIKNGVTGFVFPNENVGALSQILEEVISNDALRKSKAQAGRDYAIKHFSSEVMTRKTLQVYEKVLGS